MRALQESGCSSLPKVEETFRDIPSRKILEVANDIQAGLRNNKTLEEKKGEGECDWVTAADTKIQELVLDYFSKSPLAGTYITKAEENIKDTVCSGNEQWQLLIDPLDGTSAFRIGKETWGVMVGWCDKNGVAGYSWNLISTGDVYQTESNPYPVSRESLAAKVQRRKRVKIDVYDYSGKALPRFEDVFGRAFLSREYELTSYPAAVWAGWRLSQGDCNESDGLDALLWLPSNEGKKWYPDYDLIFLGALPQRGLHIKLGKIDGKNALLAIAPSREDVDKLCGIGLDLLGEKQKQHIIFPENPLQITQPI